MDIVSKINSDKSHGGRFSIDNVQEGWDTTSVLYLGGLIKEFWNGTEWIESATDIETTAYQDKITTENIILKYTTVHEPNGYDYYQRFKAYLITDLYKTVITQAEAIQIENLLSTPMLKIKQNGDWKTALYELSVMTETPAFIQVYRNKAIQEITEYITKNYED